MSPVVSGLEVAVYSRLMLITPQPSASPAAAADHAISRPAVSGRSAAISQWEAAAASGATLLRPHISSRLSSCRDGHTVSPDAARQIVTPQVQNGSVESAGTSVSTVGTFEDP